jgi:tellurite methyltransferase
MKPLPATAAPYRRTKIFTQDTVPNGLLTDHTTKAGVWGVITVLEDRLEYVIPSEGETVVLDLETPGIVEPEVPHHVRLIRPAAFYVEFYR